MSYEKQTVELSFLASANQIQHGVEKLIKAVCEGHLGRPMTRAEEDLIKQHANPIDILLIDLIYDGKKVGSISTTYILDSPRKVIIAFEPI